MASGLARATLAALLKEPPLDLSHDGHLRQCDDDDDDKSGGTSNVATQNSDVVAVVAADAACY